MQVQKNKKLWSHAHILYHLPSGNQTWQWKCSFLNGALNRWENHLQRVAYLKPILLETHDKSSGEHHRFPPEESCLNRSTPPFLSVFQTHPYNRQDSFFLSIINVGIAIINHSPNHHTWVV